TDPDDIDATGEIPQSVFDGLAKLGAFGIKIPAKYGGLGLSQTNYCRAAILLGSHCGNLTALLSAHQSIGVPQPLILFGTEEQKQRFLPRVAAGGRQESGHRIHRGSEQSRRGGRAPLPFHGAARALQRRDPLSRRDGAARKYPASGRERAARGADYAEHRTPDASRRLHGPRE